MAPREPVGEWSETDHFTARDGREFSIFSEHVRGEPRFYYAKENMKPSGGTGWPEFSHAHLPFDGAYRKDTVKRRVERYVRETTKIEAG